MKSFIISASAQNGAWGSESWQAPVRGTVVGVLLDLTWINAGGAGSDRLCAAGVFESQPSGGGFTAITAGSYPCWAFLETLMAETATANDKAEKTAFVPLKIRMAASQLLWLGCFCDSTVHSAVAHLVIQFEPDR